MTDNLLNVLYFCSDLFVDVAATSIVSLLENNKEFGSINIYVIDDGISETKREMLSSLVASYSRNIAYVDAPDPSEFFQFPFKSRYQMGHSYMRMCIGSLVPESVDRLLCLDSDTLVTGSLARLWQTDLNGKILAGVADCVNLKAFRKQFMLSEDDVYCNAGVFLVNMNEWRGCNVEERIRETIREHNGNIFFFEQTLMNYACRERIVRLAPIYNAYTLFFAMSYKNLMRWRRPTNFYSDAEAREATEHPVIVHFTRNFYLTSRPWVKGCAHPLTADYLGYKNLTPWNTVEEDGRPWKKKLIYRLVHIVPQGLLAFATNILYNDIRPLLFWKNE